MKYKLWYLYTMKIKTVEILSHWFCFTQNNSCQKNILVQKILKTLKDDL